MFRLTQYLREIENPTPLGTGARPSGPVVIWNLLRRCNLACRHCYSISADHDFPGELATPEIFAVMDDLKRSGAPVLILSGGEPLLHPDIFSIARRAKDMGFYVGLSTNGTLINEHNAGDIAAAGFDYVGVSLDGMRDTHDRFRRMPGGYDAALRGIRLVRDAGLKVGVRFTLTQDNAQDLPHLLELIERERVFKFYMSHLNYAGRGNVNRARDALHLTTRWAIDLLLRTACDHLRRGLPTEFVTGNNDADAIWLLRWAVKHHPGRVAHLRAKLGEWGGNSSGIGIANIDNLGNVHPDTMWWEYTIGNVRERPFSELWNDVSDPLMRGLRQRPRPVRGRCAQCRFLDVCNGNTRTRAWQLTGDPWAEDPACYLTDEELGIADASPRLVLTPYSRARRTAPEGSQ
ncbi:MAG TPA: heme d1 biosynthesis radical SAM protein NirJ [Burkholderiales bacterium]|nr:heme d1 biosynthesis radical SAM protein NirJ [Burkholderiales bacterium]